MNFYLQAAFDHQKARADSVIIPARGVDRGYDDACDRLKKCEHDLDEYLREQRRMHSCSVWFI